MVFLEKCHKISWLSRSKKTLANQVDPKHTEYLGNLVDDVISIGKNMQPRSIFIDEIALYKLSLRSRKKFAHQFLEWVTESVLPKIRNEGFYKLDELKTKEMEELKKELYETKIELDESKIESKEKDKVIKKLETNLKTKKLPQNPGIYCF